MWERLRALRSRWRMLRKPAPEFALVVIDLACLVTGAASLAALCDRSTIQAGCWAAFGVAVTLFGGSLWQYDDEQQALIEKVLRVENNPVTRSVTHGRISVLILLLGLAMIGAATRAG
jgi:hypothetical protein